MGGGASSPRGDSGSSSKSAAIRAELQDETDEGWITRAAAKKILYKHGNKSKVRGLQHTGHSCP
jgi:hypothetical protein